MIPAVDVTLKGRVVAAGGVDPSLGGTPERDQRNMEIFYPKYLNNGPRALISNSPASIGYNDPLIIISNQTVNISSVCLIEPQSQIHHSDAGHRYIKLELGGIVGNDINVVSPSSPFVEPPGD